MSDHTDFEGLSVQLRNDGVGVVMFNRPERLNAVTVQSFADLETALRRLGADSGCGAVVIGGEGAAFCAGMDMADSRPNKDDDLVRLAYDGMRSTVGSVLALRDIPQPVVAAVQGAAVGAGLGLALVAGQKGYKLKVVVPFTLLIIFVLLYLTFGAFGEALRVVLLSVAEGDDKPAKYPHMFAVADVVVFGHSHDPVDAEGIDGQRLFNPGSPTQRRRAPVARVPAPAPLPATCRPGPVPACRARRVPVVRVPDPAAAVAAKGPCPGPVSAARQAAAAS